VYVYAIHTYTRGSGIAIRCWLHGPGIESPWWWAFSHPSGPALGPTRTPIQWVQGHSPG